MVVISIQELTKETGVTVRTLRYYDQIDLLKPSGKQRVDIGYIVKMTLFVCNKFYFERNGIFIKRSCEYVSKR